jgi:hypothetical protein
MLQKNHPNYLMFLFMPIFLLVSTSVKSQIDDLDNSIQDSMSDTISQVNNIDLGEAKSELAEGIDDAMGKMGEGMEFALKALEGGDAETALKTMDMLTATMDMAIGVIPKEEFMDFSKLKLDDFSPEELAAAQSMMGDMMAQSMSAMTDMMENMSHVEDAGFDMSGFMGSMDKSGFGFETMFSENMERMGAMFGEDMSMMGQMVGDDIFGDGKGFGDFEQMMSGHENMDMGEMMSNMEVMGDMSEMMSEHMDFESFADMVGMMDGDQMEMMTEGMMEMMEQGSFDGFAGNMTMMGDMIRGKAPPEGMGEEGQGDFFSGGEKDAQMMDMMNEHVENIGVSFAELSSEQQEIFMQEAAESSWIGTGTADMSNFDSSWKGEASPEFGENTGLGMGDGMGAGGKPMFGSFGDSAGGDVFGDGAGFGDMDSGMFEQMGDTMGEAFGGSSGEGGFINEAGPDTGQGMGDGYGSGGKKMGGGSCEGGGCD